VPGARGKSSRINRCITHSLTQEEIKEMSFHEVKAHVQRQNAEWAEQHSYIPAATRAQVRSCLTRRNRLAKVAHGTQLASPLHAKKVVPMNLEKLLRDMHSEAASRITHLLNQLAEAKPSSEPISPKFQVPHDDVLKLIAAGALEEYTGDKAVPVRYFTVYEALKNRRRPIMWPWTFLLSSEYNSEFSLKNVHDYCNSVHDGQFSCAFDLSSSFWQVLLPHCNFVVQDKNGKQYRITRLPFGVDCASEIMQLIVQELGRLACNRAGIVIDLDVKLYVHIDNIMCVGSKEMVEKWRKAFESECKSFDVTLNDEPENNEVSMCSEFAGIQLNFRAKSVRPRDAFIKGLPTASDALSTWSELESCIGKILYGMAIRQMRQHQYHQLFFWWRKCLASLCRAGDNDLRWDERPNPNNSIRLQIGQILAALADRTPANVLRSPVITSDSEIPPSDRRVDVLPILAVDATLHSFGGVLYERGHVVAAYGERFEREASSMGIAEIAGALAMITHFARRLRGRRFVLLTDNSAAEIGAKRGASSHLDMDRAAFGIHAILRDIGASVIVGHVASADNVADAVSRAEELKYTAIVASRIAAQEAVDLLKQTGGVGVVVRSVVKKCAGG
jgi:hypothetical protein